MPHPFIPDSNGLGCDDCPLPQSHPIHAAPASLHAPPPVPDPGRVALPSPDALGVRLTPDQSPTSLDAAMAAWPQAGTARHMVLLDLEVADADGCTDEDLAHDLEMNLNTVRPRRGELVAAGWVTEARDGQGDVVTRPTAGGNPATVWVLTPAARRHLERESLTPAT